MAKPLDYDVVHWSLVRPPECNARVLSGTALGVPLNKLGHPHLKPATSQTRLA
jgi:hypothetical protein